MLYSPAFLLLGFPETRVSGYSTAPADSLRISNGGCDAGKTLPIQADLLRFRLERSRYYRVPATSRHEVTRHIGSPRANGPLSVRIQYHSLSSVGVAAPAVFTHGGRPGLVIFQFWGALATVATHRILYHTIVSRNPINAGGRCSLPSICIYEGCVGGRGLARLGLLDRRTPRRSVRPAREGRATGERVRDGLIQERTLPGDGAPMCVRRGSPGFHPLGNGETVDER